MSRWQQMLSRSQIRQIQILACVVLAAWLIVKGVMPGWTVPHSDFSNYYVSARLVLEGENLDSLYNNEWFHAQMVEAGVNTPGKFAPFPPLTSWIMVPIAWLSPIHAQRVFLICNLTFVLVCVYGWKRITGWNIVASLLIVMAAGSSLANNIAFGQLYIITTALLLLAMDLIKRGKGRVAGIILAALTAIKYFPIVVIAGLIALLFVEREQKGVYYTTIASFGLTMAVLITIQFLFFGEHVMTEYFTSAFIPHLASDLKGQGMYSILFQSWDSLGRNLFVYDAFANPDPWISWAAGRTVLKLVVVSIAGILSLTVMFFYRQSYTRREIFIAIPALAALVILPASATYHFILLLLPISLLIGMRHSWVLVALFVAIGFIPYAWFFSLAESAGILFGYPRLWLVTILFAVAVGSLLRKPSLANAQ